MKQHVLVLGAGFGGLELAARLSESLSDELHITLVDQNDSFIFGFSKLEILFGRQTRDELRCPYREINRPGVEFRQERVTSIDPRTRHVVTDDGTYEPDILVVALGARPRTWPSRSREISRTTCSSVSPFTGCLRSSRSPRCRSVGTTAGSPLIPEASRRGGGLVGKVDADFLSGPLPKAPFVGPSREVAEDKQRFARTRRQRWFGG